MRQVTVELGVRSYPVYIGGDLLGSEQMLARHLDSRQVLVVTNTTVGPLYLKRVMGALAACETHSLTIPDGEIYKTLDVMNDIVTELLKRRFNRDAALLALGGGVVGDVTGFAAAVYQRGIRYLQLPTTLLAQVDSAVGGKTAVNHELGKNMIGAFHQPAAVISDTATLATLPPREFSAGLAEVIKYGLIRDPEFFAWLEQNMDELMQREGDALEQAIYQSCLNKAAVVAEDEQEAGVRAILNLGHTFGHAIETALNYREWLHGEAVAVGMLMAADLSRRLGWLQADVPERLKALLRRAKLPVAPPPAVDARRMRELMKVDKKARSGGLRLVLLQDLGRAVVTPDYGEAHLKETLERFAAGQAEVQ